LGFKPLLVRALLDTFFPPLCHSCKEFIPDAGPIHICAECLGRITTIQSPLCHSCGTPFATEAGIDHTCGECLQHPPRFASARAAALFDGPLKELIHLFKYAGKVQIRRPLALFTAAQLALFVQEIAPDCLVPVPLHPRKLRERGFNQALLLGQLLARQWQIPLSIDNLRRTRWTEPQITLSAEQRLQNVRGAFAVHAPADFARKRLLLLDDVYTTGNTVAECAKTLKGAGAAAIHVVTVARTVG